MNRNRNFVRQGPNGHGHQNQRDAVWNRIGNRNVYDDDQYHHSSSRSNASFQHDDRSVPDRTVRGRNVTIRNRKDGGRRRGGKGGAAAGGRRYNQDNVSTASPEDEHWFVTVTGGAKYDRLYLINLLQQSVSIKPIAFYNVSTYNQNLSFWVVGRESADSLSAISRRVTTNTGQRLEIRTRRQVMPPTAVDERTRALIKSTMSRLYNLQTRVMDLSHFRDAEEFRQEGLFLATHRPNVLRIIAEVIVENTPNLVALNLSNNRITSLEQFTTLNRHCTELRALDLQNNKISSIEEIAKLKELNLEELIVTGNPCVENMATFTSSIRKIFVNLKKLDHEDLPREIGFDLGEQQQLPESKPNHIPEQVNTFVYQFLEAYYKIFDSDNRDQLTAAYHNDATFTYSYARHNDGPVYKVTDPLSRDSHNLLRLKDESLWVKFVKTNIQDIVTFLRRFPVTEHDPASFHIDIPLMEPSVVIVVVNGLFTELYKSNRPKRAFCRTFFIVPQGSGYVIINDMLMITNLSLKQIQANNQYKSSSASTSKDATMAVEFMPSHATTINTNFGSIAAGAASTSLSATAGSTPNISLIASPSGVGIGGAGVMSSPIGTLAAANTTPKSINNAATTAPTTNTSFTTNQMEEIIAKFMAVTNMNRDFSKRCLEENNYNAEVAFSIFQKLQANNVIPAEAFIK